jgi:hypothetical protein
VHGNRTHHGHLCPSLDLKSRRPTRTCPLPHYNLMDSLFKVKIAASIRVTNILPFRQTKMDAETSSKGIAKALFYMNYHD